MYDSSAKTPGLWLEAKTYASNIRFFQRSDWFFYLSYMGLIASLLVGLAVFFGLGASQGVEYPGYVWFIPGGTALFVLALSFDDIGHRTLYKESLKKGEGYIHQMIIITAVTSVMALCLCYQHPLIFMPAAVGLTALSFFYSAVDEALHWYRYLRDGLDRIEMWSHFFAILGHVLMISAWWVWFQDGYPGVAETLALLP